MTTQDLIEKLQELDPDGNLDIRIEDSDGTILATGASKVDLVAYQYIVITSLF